MWPNQQRPASCPESLGSGLEPSSPGVTARGEQQDKQKEEVQQVDKCQQVYLPQEKELVSDISTVKPLQVMASALNTVIPEKLREPQHVDESFSPLCRRVGKKAMRRGRKITFKSTYITKKGDFQY